MSAFRASVATLVLSMGLGAWLGGQTNIPALADRPSIARSERIETFVLTPIRMESISICVPAEIVGPVTNNSCHNWESRSESCYLPARELLSSSSRLCEGSASLLRDHLSAMLEAWKPGAWPADGATVDIPLEQYSSFEHLWLTHRIEVRESISGCWLDDREDPGPAVARAATRPAAELAVEVFAGTRDARGFPAKTHQ